MAKTLNRVQLIGRLGADPEVKVTAADMTVTSFSLATNRQWKNRDGELQEETDWHNIVAWDRLGQICGEHLAKGRLVYIEGRIRYRSWEQDGQKAYRTEIVATDMLLLDGKGTGPADSSAAPALERREMVAAGSKRPAKKPVEQTEPGFDEPDDLPF